MENVLQELLAAIFWAPIHFKRYQNASGCGTVCKKDVLRIFAKFTGKTLCQSLFFNKVAGCNKETLAQVFYCKFCEILKNTFFTEHLWKTATFDFNLKAVLHSRKANNFIF